MFIRIVKVIDRTVEVIDRTLKVMDRTLKVIDRTSTMIDRTSEVMNKRNRIMRLVTHQVDIEEYSFSYITRHTPKNHKKPHGSSYIT